MNFSGLRAIIKNIKAHVSCPHCENTYSDDDVNVVSSVGDRCVLVAQCESCLTPILITATVKVKRNENQLDEIITEQRRLADISEEEFVSSDDVVNVHQFLKKFKGDFKDIFKESREKR